MADDQAPAEMYVTLYRHVNPREALNERRQPEVLDGPYLDRDDADGALAFHLDQAREEGDHLSWYATAKVTIVDGPRTAEETPADD